MLVVAVALLIAMLLVLVVLAAAAQGEELVLLELREQPTLAVAVAVVVIQAPLVVQVAQVLSLFVTQILTQPQRLRLAHPQSRLLVVIVSINGLDQGVSHSDGTLCTTQRTKHSHASYCRGKSRTAFGRH
jgi:hypothetical protein